MKSHVTELLAAYHDGELTSHRKQQVENHLLECATCSAELKSFRELSSLLKMDVVPQQISTERFVANVTLSLPHQREQSQSRKALEIGWWLIPVGALGAWLFLQITFSLSSVVLTVSETGLLGNGFSWLQGNASQVGWFSLAMDLFGGQIGSFGQFILSELNDLSLFIQDLTSPYIWQALFATLYLGWLVSWWLRQSNQTTSVSAVSQS